MVVTLSTYDSIIKITVLTAYLYVFKTKRHVGMLTMTYLCRIIVTCWLSLGSNIVNVVIVLFVSQGNGVVETYWDGRVRSECSRHWSPWGLDLLREEIQSRPVGNDPWHSSGKNFDATPSVLPPSDSNGKQENRAASTVTTYCMKLSDE